MLIYTVGVITRAISVAADAMVLGLTLWETHYIFKTSKETRASHPLIAVLTYNSNTIISSQNCDILMIVIFRLYSIWVWL